MGGQPLLRHSLDALAGIDRRLVLDLNFAISINPVVEKIIDTFANNPLIRGSVVFFSLVAVWFRTNSDKRRSRIFAGLLATFTATALSVWVQYHLTFHIRPFLDPTLHLKSIEAGAADGWDRLGSFPSDTAMLYFCLSAVIFLEHRKAGGVAFLWSLITVGVIRIAQGWHYPSDIAGSLIIGPACVYLFSEFQYLTNILERLLRLCGPRVYVVHAILFLFLADAYNLFPGLRGFVHALSIIRTHLMG
jgi:membrane-associated phospholipid phosphatase